MHHDIFYLTAVRRFSIQVSASAQQHDIRLYPHSLYKAINTVERAFQQDHLSLPQPHPHPAKSTDKAHSKGAADS